MKNTLFSRLFVISLILSGGIISFAQDVEITDEVIKVETKSVQTTLRASNSKGKATSVSRNDLRLLVNGQEQKIDYFATEQIKKFTILLDASDSMKGRRYKRCVWFLNELAESSLPGQSFDVITFAEKTQFIGTFTKKDKKQVFDKLKNLKPDGNTALYDSVVHTLEEFDKLTDSRALIVITDGGDNVSTVATKDKADYLLSKYGTLTYLIVLDTKMAYRDPLSAPGDDIAKAAVKDFQKILQPVAFIIKNEIQFNQLATNLAREAGFLIRIGFDPNEVLLPDKETHKLEIIHSDNRLQLNYRQSFSVKGVR